MQRQMDPKWPQSTSSVTEGGEELDGPGCSDNKSYPARELRSAKIKTSQAERRKEEPVARMTPLATSVAETQTIRDWMEAEI